MKRRAYLDPDNIRVSYTCPPGWECLMEEFVSKTDRWMREDDDILGLNPWKDFEVLQVKEKWNRLTIYVSNVPDDRLEDMNALIGTLGDRSLTLCMECSKTFAPPHLNAVCSEECREKREDRHTEQVLAWRESK